ncbi:MAG: hypothetical protein GF403_05270 [Candidatus Coatesbacteria bacterium]|nr:hypothetical protein [Candidatus Coatesbacteria bacterium]
MDDLAFFIILGFLILVGLVLALKGGKGEDPLVARRRYLAVAVDIAAVLLTSLFRFGALGALFGGC